MILARQLAALLGGSALALLSTAPAAAQRARPARFDVGRDASGDICSASRVWSQGQGTLIEARQPYVLTCRGSTQRRGFIEAIDAADPVSDRCGAPTERAIEGLGSASLRLCRDPRLGIEAVEVRYGRYRGVAGAGTIAPLLTALRMVATRGVASTPVAFDPASLDALPKPSAAAVTAAAIDATAHDVAGATGLDAAGAVQLGLRLIYAGRNVEASRLLNDAVAEFATAPLLQRAELRLNAGLADSNIGESAAAAAHLREAQALLAEAPASPARSALESQATTYRALDYTNQSRWTDVLSALDAAPVARSPLNDATTLSELNQTPGISLQAGLDTAYVNQQILTAQQEITRSTAHLRLGDPAKAEASLAAATAAAGKAQAALTARESGSSSGALAWLQARLERQRGRIQAASGNIDGALSSFDCAIARMQALPPPTAGCIALGDGRGEPLSGPVIAEAELERTTILAGKPGVDRALLLANYEKAIDALADAAGAGATTSPLLARYLDLLVEDGRSNSASAEKYFRALQTVRSPGIAREYAALQSVVAGGRSGGLIRDRQDLERRQSQLRYEIAGLADGSPRLAEARKERDSVGADLDRVRAELARSGAASAVDDQPVTLAEVERALRPGEAYLKIVDVGTRLYGVVVSPEGPIVYAVEKPAAAISALADAVLVSARSRTDAQGRTRINPFASDMAFALFQQIAGPASMRLTQAKAVVVDTGAALGSLPAAILVTGPTLKQASARTDYGAVPFLVKQAELATSLSPRAFLRVRSALAPSRAKQALIGFGENALAPAAPSPAAGQALVSLAPACRIQYAQWAEIYNQNRPIPVDEIRAGAVALGDPGAPIVTGAAFNDAAIQRDSAKGKLARYQVLHFATHGIPAEPVPGHCDTPLPPSLITSLQPPTGDTPSPSNGLLSYVDVARLVLDANLVVLSACETASSVDTQAGRLAGQEDSAPTLDGLVRAFIVAQARAVMATYWRVPAKMGTQDLITTFYQRGRNAGMGQALRQAQLSVLSNPSTSHPYYWAAFFLVGDGAKTMLTRPTSLASRD